jgi:polyisoprenoid-binding protein YceI
MPCNKWLAVVPLMLLMSSCTHVPAPVAAPAAPSPEAPLAARPAGAVDYRIDAAHSSLRVLAYRGGPLSSLGHNHVIEDKALSGWIRAGKDPRTSSFYLQLALKDFVIDLPEARAEEGADFSEAVEESARAGTQHNMLGAALLNAERYPTIQIESVSVQGDGVETGRASRATFKVTIAGRANPVTAPFTLDRQPGSLHVKADFWLPQTSLGLTPFSALLGGLQVANDLHLKLDVAATSPQSAGLD